LWEEAWCMQTTEERTAALHASSEEKYLSWFRDRHWRVSTEITGDRTKDGHKIFYFKGFFQVEGPGVFQTPLRHKGRKGYLIQETGADGKDLPGTKPVPFGRTVLERASGQFGHITGLPKRDPRRRAGKWTA